MKLLISNGMSKFWFFLAAFLLITGITPSQELDPEIPDISKRINAFTLNFLKHNAGGKQAAANTIISGQNIFHGLAMSYIGSDGKTREELANVLKFPDSDEQLINELSKLKQQWEAPSNQNRSEVIIASSIWLDSTYADFKKTYVDTVEKSFGSSLHSVKFEHPHVVTSKINKWISEKTNGKIHKSVNPANFKSKSGSGIIDEPALVSVNSVYFKADWASQFDKSLSHDYPFNIDTSTTIDAPMMHQNSLLSYSENGLVKFLELPYVDEEYSMRIILPKKISSVKSLLDMVSIEMITDLKRMAYNHEVDVILPKFEMRNHLNVKHELLDMGVKSAFDRQSANFDKMIDKKVEAFRIYLNEVYQDAWIDVSEEGTEAASATRATHRSFGCSARPMPAQFHADRPFLFMIVHNQSRSILFAGWISNPKKVQKP